jgi:pimeloyl-ACP methyl ester carboxylesterase
MRVSEQELLQAGISALKANDKERAASIFSQLVRQYPHSEGGWYLLGMSLDDAQKRAYCFERALNINPNNPDAKKQIALLYPPAPVPPAPAFATPEPGVIHVPAFLEEEAELEEFPEDPQPEPESAPQAKPPAKTPKRKKNNNVVIIAAAIGGFCILALTAAFALNMLFNNGNTTASQPPAPALTSTPAIVIGGETATATPEPPTSLPTAAPTVAYTPQFEETPCQFDTPFGVRVTCGYAILPENRTSANGRTIRLAVAVFHSQSSSPKPDPVIFLQGGPGGEAISLSVNAYSILVAPFLEDRDYIAYDQRGTGLSEPALVCDELEKANRQDVYGTIDSSSRELVYQYAFLSCAGLLQSKGIDLSAYNTVENAADLKDIVKLLGYEKVNLYGASYGTRLGLVAMRNHPEVVRSAILDSVMPVESNWVNEYPNIANYTLTTLFESCKADPGCNAAYPDIETVFWDLAGRLDESPITLSTSAYPMGTVTETIDGSYLLSIVMGLSKATWFINTVPQTIYRVRDGDYSTLIAAQYSLPYGFEGINTGLYISVMCREHVLDTTPEQLASATNQLRVKDFIWRPFYENLEKMYSACKTWGSSGPVLGEKDAVVSDIPSLIITGTFDSATPPQLGRQAAENLANSFYFDFPNQGHVPTVSDDSGCAMQIALEFLKNPLIEPSRDCMTQLPPVKFLVPYTGNPAIELERQNFNGVSLTVPPDWSYVDNGFLWRGSSSFDITQVTAFRAPISVEDLVDYFSSSINGYRGFDGAPSPAGTRQANGHSWTLYYTTSNGRPVDVAAVDDGGSSLVIVMFSHPDEHDALYRAVFLPMVDSAR